MNAHERRAVVRRAQEAGYFDDALWAWGHAPTWSASERRASWALHDKVIDLVGRVDRPEATRLAVAAMAAHWSDALTACWTDRVRHFLKARRPRPSRARTSPGRTRSGDGDRGE